MGRNFTVVIERDRAGWLVGTVPSLPGCFTQARTQDELLERIREAIQACLADEPADEEELEFVGLQRVRVP
jgi:predicted RNase H-like HicB family nuclease